MEQARCWQLALDNLELSWGMPFDYEAIVGDWRQGDIGWLWFSHCETSTGQLNDLERIKQICNDRRALLRGLH